MTRSVGWDLVEVARGKLTASPSNRVIVKVDMMKKVRIAAQTYREMGLKLGGGEPKISQGLVYCRDALQPIPFSPLALLRSSLFTWTEKWEMIQLLKRVTSLNPIEQQGQTVADWLEVIKSFPGVLPAFKPGVDYVTTARKECDNTGN
jgi:hypothetical protein